MTIFLICMAIVVVAVVAMVITYVYERKHKKQNPEGETEARRKEDKERRKIRKGIEGEDHVEHLLDEIEEPCRIFRDIVLDTAQGSIGTTEVDFVVLCSYGIFVLDVKSWDGIYKCDVHKGKSGNFNYDLIKYDNGEKVFKSCEDQAIMRNGRHYNAVRHIITDHASKRLNKWLAGKFHSYVVFRQDNFSGECDRAVNAKDLIQTIRGYSGKLNEEDVQEIAEIMRDHHSKVTREEHIRKLVNMFPNDTADPEDLEEAQEAQEACHQAA
ncbi:MAG: NERD domain-containing protein [Clostridia bacterium]|nr:NERD domain-containing protein [Clostridia bacterium]